MNNGRVNDYAHCAFLLAEQISGWFDKLIKQMYGGCHTEWDFSFGGNRFRWSIIHLNSAYEPRWVEVSRTLEWRWIHFRLWELRFYFKTLSKDRSFEWELAKGSCMMNVCSYCFFCAGEIDAVFHSNEAELARILNNSKSTPWRDKNTWSTFANMFDVYQLHG